MVSLWPWRGSDNSPASFEKTLSTLSARIAQTNSRLDSQRQRARRFKALWTLYTTFAYILYSLILGLVLGWERWGTLEYVAVAGGPVVIYVVRSVAQSFYKYRISKTQSLLDDLQKQRNATIEKLKEATKYNSTLQLLEKYGAESPASAEKKGDPREKAGEHGKDGMRHRGSRERTPVQVAPGERTTMPPPPTANIPRPQYGPSSPATPIRQQQSPPSSPPSPTPASFIAPTNNQPTQNQPDEPGFHPSAYPTQQYDERREPQWYDRILDVLLGEDETLPKNRLALICSRCRLVNGQAAPGIRTLEELGRWRCGGCGEWNGQDQGAKRLSGGSELDLGRQQSRSGSLSQSNPQVVVEPASPVGSAWKSLSNDGSLSSAGVEAESTSGGEGTDASIIHAPSGSDEDLEFDDGDAKAS